MWSKASCSTLAALGMSPCLAAPKAFCVCGTHADRHAVNYCKSVGTVLLLVLCIHHIHVNRLVFIAACELPCGAFMIKERNRKVHLFWSRQSILRAVPNVNTSKGWVGTKV